MSFKNWFFERAESKSHQQDHWLNVMCLTGVDYFSSLGFAPAMAFVYAGILSPTATFLLVLLNIFGAYPMYSKVAEMSPHGQGSIAILQDLLPRWWGKLLVLCLLGFAATDFIMTITLCSSDAAKHIVDNPWCPAWLHHQIILSLSLVILLGTIFLKGFRDAIWIGVILVWSYLGLTLAVLGVSFQHILVEPTYFSNWYQTVLTTHHNSMVEIAALSALTFPKLALGMSGFETGVAVMPHVRGFETDTEEFPEGRIKNTKKLLFTAALIMGFFLLTSSVATTLLIPPAEFADHGNANGRALAYLAHKLMGDQFGTIYDTSTLLILWFAGASAMAGLLNLIPRYLPRFGMSPSWVASIRPLVLLITIISTVVVLYFKADVDAQAGAFATGLLVLMTSAALAATLAVWKQLFQRLIFAAITLLFSYTTVNNIISRPEGLHVASIFILIIIGISFLSRCFRSTELRVLEVSLDAKAQEFLEESRKRYQGEIRLLAHRPGGTDYQTKEEEARDIHSIQRQEGDFIFLEVTTGDPSTFIDDTLDISGVERNGYKIWRCTSPSVPNAIAALLLKLRDDTEQIPHAYFGWTEGHPLGYVFKYILFGEGETAPLTREILRSAEPNPKRRPRIHVS